MPHTRFLQKMDRLIIVEAKHGWFWAARIALFIVYFWFGLLKVLALSPASPLVTALLVQTMPDVSAAAFLPVWGIFECVIGVLFLVPRLSRINLTLVLVHMVAVFLPLVLLPGVTWTAPFIPTLEGQYIIKNLLIVALAVGLAAQMKPMKK